MWLLRFVVYVKVLHVIAINMWICDRFSQCISFSDWHNHRLNIASYGAVWVRISCCTCTVCAVIAVRIMRQYNCCARLTQIVTEWIQCSDSDSMFHIMLMTEVLYSYESVNKCTVSGEKLCHVVFGFSFAKCWNILKILPLPESAVNCQYPILWTAD